MAGGAFQQRSWSSSSGFCSSFQRKLESLFRLVIPAQAGMKLLWTGSRASCAGSVGHPAAGLLLFACPKRSNQEKGHPGSAPSEHPVLRVRERATEVFRAHIRVRRKTRAHRARAPSGLILRPLAAAQGPRGGAAHIPCAQKRDHERAFAVAFLSSSFPRERTALSTRSCDLALSRKIPAAARSAPSKAIPRTRYTPAMSNRGADACAVVSGCVWPCAWLR